MGTEIATQRAPRANFRIACAYSLAIALCLTGATSTPFAQEKRTAPMPQHAAGTFDVKNTPMPSEDSTGGAAIGRFALDKQFHGDLEGTSKGQMLAGGDPSTGTAGYVAMEYVTGTLHGRSGSFALQHLGTMSGGNFYLNVIVVPGS